MSFCPDKPVMAWSLDTVASAPGCPQTTFVVKFRAEPLRQEGNTMCGPGEYRPDPSAGITAPADLPQPEIVPYSRNDLRQPCPRCGPQAYRDKQYQRTLHDLGNLDLWCPRDLVPIRSTTVRSVASTFTRISLIWHHPALSTPTA